MRTSAKMLFSNSIWSLLSHLVRVASIAGITVALSRHFGPRLFGSFAFALAFVRIFGVIAAFGLDRVIVKQLAEAPEKAGAILRAALRLKFGIAGLAYLVLLAAVFMVDPHDRTIQIIVTVAGIGLMFQPFDVFDYAFQAQSRFRWTFVGRAVPLLIGAALKVTAIILGAPLLTFAFFEALEASLIALALVIVYQRTRPRKGETSRGRVDWRPWVAQGVPLLLSSLAVMIYMRSDVIMLGKIAGFRAAGIYSAASQICEACAVLPMAILPVLFPAFVKWRSKGADYYSRRYQKIFFAAALIGLSTSLFLCCCAPFIVRTLYGESYSSSTNVLMIQSWSVIFFYLGIMQVGYDVTENLTWLATLRTAVGACLNIALNLILIPRYGAEGAAFGSCLAQASSTCLLNAAHKRTRPIFIMQVKAILIVPCLPRGAAGWRRTHRAAESAAVLG